MSLGAFIPATKGSWADDEPEEVPTPPPVTSGSAWGGASAPSAGGYAPAPPSSGKPIPSSGPYILFVGNLSYDVEQGDLEHEFADCGIVSVRVIRHRDTDRVRGCFIELQHADGLRAGLARDGKPLRGRAMRCDVGEAQRKDSGASHCALPTHARAPPPI